MNLKNILGVKFIINPLNKSFEEMMVLPEIDKAL